MTDRYASDLQAAELRALRDTANRLVVQRDLARAWAVRLESMLEGACELLREYGRWPCLDCHRGEQDGADNPAPFDAVHHDPDCRIAKVLADADADRGGR